MVFILFMYMGILSPIISPLCCIIIQLFVNMHALVLPNSLTQRTVYMHTGMGCNHHAKSEIVQGVLLVFQQLFANILVVAPSLTTLKQVRNDINEKRVYMHGETVCACPKWSSLTLVVTDNVFPM